MRIKEALQSSTIQFDIYSILGEKLEEVREVCRHSYIDEYIMSLPNKYDTLLGEGGVNLSGGQKAKLLLIKLKAGVSCIQVSCKTPKPIS